MEKYLEDYWIVSVVKKKTLIKAVKNYKIACKIQYYNESHKEDYILKDRKAIVKIIEKWLDGYGESNNVPPWAAKKSILATAMEGYSFGAERSQVRSINDNDHIIPLYN